MANVFYFRFVGIVLTLRNGIENRKKLIKKYFYLLVIAIVLVGIRVFFPTEKHFIFFFWNMFLAIVPLILSSFLLELSKRDDSRWTTLLVGFLWLIFFPNAPYVFTDFTHLQHSEGVMLIIDFITVLYFAIWAFITAIISLNDCLNLLNKYVSQWISIPMIAFISCLSGFGIYLGRDLRLNSWDVIARPIRVVEQSVNSIHNFSTDYNTWISAISISLMMFVGVLAYHFVDLNRQGGSN